MNGSSFFVDSYLETLGQIASLLSSRRAFGDILEELLELLAARMQFPRLHIVVHDTESGRLKLSLCYGGSVDPDADLAPGTGVAGKVFATGQSTIIPCMQTSMEFKNRFFGRDWREMEHLAFISVPVVIRQDGTDVVIGVLSADTPRAEDGELAQRCRFLEVVASLIAGQVSWLQEDMARQHYHRITEAAEGGISIGSIISESRCMRHVMHQIQQVAPSRATVLLRGESGVGKELIAQALHETSLCSGGPFVKMNCAAIPTELVEGELFGWRKGAFTGAVSNRKGLFQQADKGTLFLDEIGDLSLSAQAKMLRVLQDGIIQQLGSERVTAVNVRIVCATNRPLEELVEKGLFRNDLYYRINIFPIFIPSLRERHEDVLPLARHYLKVFASEYHRPVTHISTPALDLLQEYAWPGNIRELKNVMERAVLLCEEDALRVYHLPSDLQNHGASRKVGMMRENGAGFTETVECLEKELLTDALTKANGNIHQVARDVGLTYRIVYYKMKKYGLDYRDFTH